MNQKSLLRRAIELAVSCAYHLSHAVAGRGRKRIRNANRRTVVYYHSVMGDMLARFEAQAERFAELTENCPIDRILASGTGEKPSLCVTNDDALESFFDNAFPILREKGIPVCTFVPVGWLGKKVGWEIKRDLSSTGDRVITQDRLLDLIRNYGVSVGSHGVTHRDLTQLDERELLNELRDSKALLEDVSGMEVKGFSFPYGAFGERELTCAAEVGYTEIHSTLPGCIRVDHPSFVIPRMRVDPDDWPLEFRLKIVGSYQWLGRVSKLKRKLLSSNHELAAGDYQRVHSSS